MKQQKLQQAPANLILEGYDTYAVKYMTKFQIY